MRTTITLDPEVALLVERTMRERDLSFKQVVNDAIRAGLGSGGGKRFRQRTFDMGAPRVDVTKALELAARLEDEAIARKLDVAK